MIEKLLSAFCQTQAHFPIIGVADSFYRRVKVKLRGREIGEDRINIPTTTEKDKRKSADLFFGIQS